MKKLLFILGILLFLLSATNLFAQPDWQWGQEVRANAQSIGVDNYGNTYVTWSLQDNYEIDGELFISNGSSDVALTSFDCNGNHRWTKIIGGSSSDVPRGLGTDTLGGVYMTCNVNGARLANYSVDIANDTIIAAGQRGFLLVKYDTEGVLQWFRMPEDTVIFNLPDDLQVGAARDLEVTPDGACYVYSRLFPGTYGDGAYEATFETTLNNGGADIYALKYTSNGNCIGGVHFDVWYSGSSFLANNQISRDQHTGRFCMSGSLDIDDSVIIFGGEQVTAENYVVQFDSSGFVNWRISADDPGISHTYFVGKPSVDKFGNVYVTGDSYNNNSFGGFVFNNTINTANFPIFAKIDSLGNVVYASNASVSSVSKGKATAYSNNQVALTGDFASEIHWGDFMDDPDNSQLSNVFLTTFDPSGTGLPNSLNVLYGSANATEYPSLLVADNQDNFYVGGRFSSQLYVGEDTIYNQTGTQEGFIAKFGSDSCYCPLPVAVFSYDSIPDEAGAYSFAYTGTAGVDSVIWDFGDGQTASGTDVNHLFAETGNYIVCATAYNSCGTDSVCVTITAVGPDAVRSINGFEEISLYPNPALETLTIANALPGTRVDVFNAVGVRMDSYILNATTNQMDVHALPPGVYLLQLTDRDEIRGYGRFVKE